MVSRRHEQIIKILKFLRPYLKWLVAGQIFMLFSVGLRMIFPWVIKDIFDTMIRREELAQLSFLIAGLTAVFSLQAITTFFKSYALSCAGENVVKDMRVAVYRQLQLLSLDFFARNRVGDLVSRFTSDIGLVQQTFTSGITRLIRQVLSLISGVIILFILDVHLTLISLIVVPLVVFSGKRLGIRLKEISQRVQDRLGAVSTILEQSLSGISIIKSFQLEDYVVDEFHRENQGLFSETMDGVKVRAGISSVVGFLNDLVMVVVMGYGGLRVINGPMTPGELIAYILYIQTITGPISDLTGVYADLQRALGAANRVFELLNAEPEITEPQDPVALNKVKGYIEFDNVTFSYRKGEEILSGISFKVNPGETVALVGPSGAGKSTLARLIPRFYDVDDGRILIDGIDVRSLSLSDLREEIGIVAQDPYLFGISISDNIACGNLDASSDDIRRAARAANAHDFICTFPQDYSTQVGERGVRLSGGQKQRISIARSILKDPSFLILDEATSSLDTVSEREVQQALVKIAESRTTLIIAHRLSTVLSADKILVLDNGRIVQEGPHHKLIREDGLYARLYRESLFTEQEGVESR